MNNVDIKEEILILVRDTETSDTPLFLSLFNNCQSIEHLEAVAALLANMKLYETEGIFRLPFQYKKGMDIKIGDMFHLTTITQPGRLEYKVRELNINEMIDVNTVITDIITSDRNHPKILLYISYKQYEEQLRITQSIIKSSIRENTLSNILDK